MPSPKEIEMTVASVIRHALELRQAGVKRLCLDTLAIEFEPFSPEHEYEVDAKPDERPKSLWNDPDLYGRPQDATVPGIKKEK
jgi:hypothetical protein